MPMVDVTYQKNGGARQPTKRKKGEPRPISTVGGGRSGSLMAFAQGHGGPDS